MGVDPAQLRREMVDSVSGDDLLGRWRAALAPWVPSLLAVPRHRFIPDTVWVDNDACDGPPLVPLHRDDDPERWLRLTYADDGVATQVDDGHPTGPGLGGVLPSSSASSPAIVAVMLAALDCQAGHRVLEIGTGTGYNAALVAHRLGAENVVSIEVDSRIADRARTALAAADLGPVVVITGDGELGIPTAAPYDRVIATASCNVIPYPWVAQTRPGGRIVLPWADTYASGLVALTVAEDGVGRGSIVAESSFMWLRSQRQRRGAVRPGSVAGSVGDATVSSGSTETRVTTLHPHEITGPHGVRIAIGRRVPGCQWRYWPWEPDEPVGVLWLVDPWGSWAKLTHTSAEAIEDEFTVAQFGPRRLWDEVEAAHRWWVDQGEPGADQWQFTVGPDGQRIELQPSPDDPADPR